MYHVFEVERGQVCATWRCSAPDYKSAQEEAVAVYNRAIFEHNRIDPEADTPFANFDEVAEWLQGNGFSIHIAKIPA